MFCKPSRKLYLTAIAVVALSCFTTTGYVFSSEEAAPLFPENLAGVWSEQLPVNDQQKWIHFLPDDSKPIDIKELMESSVVSSSVENSSIQQVSGLLRRKPNRADRNCCESPGYFLGTFEEELPPGLRFSPKYWKSSMGCDSWIDVIQIEQMPALTFLCEGSCGVDEDANRTLQKSLRADLPTNDLPVTKLNLDIEPKKGRMPEQRNEKKKVQTPEIACVDRCWGERLVHWNASQASHGPLYFEEANLERHGYSRGYLQPFASGLKFFTTAPLLPGLMTIDRPGSMQYELGESRVGSATCYQKRKTPWNTKAILVEVGVVSGFSFLIP